MNNNEGKYVMRPASPDEAGLVYAERAAQIGLPELEFICFRKEADLRFPSTLRVPPADLSLTNQAVYQIQNEGQSGNHHNREYPLCFHRFNAGTNGQKNTSFVLRDRFYKLTS